MSLQALASVCPMGSNLGSRSLHSWAQGAKPHRVGSEAKDGI